MFINLVLKDFINKNYNQFIYYFILYFCNYSVEFVCIPIIFSILVSSLRQKNKVNFSFTYNLFNIFKNKYIYSIITIILGLYLFNYIFLNNNVNKIYNKLYGKLFTFVRIKLSSNLINGKKINFKELDVCKDLVSLDLSSNYIVSAMDIIMVCVFPLIIFTSIILGFFLFINIDIFIVFVISIIVIIIYILKNKNNIINSAIKKENIYLEMIKNSENSFTNLSNILINNTSNYENNKNEKLTNKYKIQNIKTYELLYSIILRCRIIYFIFKFLILLLIFKNYKNNNISLEFLIALLFVYNNYSVYFKSNIYNIIIMFKYFGQIEVNKKNFDIIIQNKNKNNKNYKINLGNIEFRNIKFKYDNKYIFNNLNLLIKQKEKVGIIGKSGSGKSTLIKLLLRFYPLESGQILIDNIDNSKFDLDYLRQNIYYINQNTHLFNETIYYNIGYGLNNNENSSNKLIDEFLKKHDLFSIFDKLEKGLENNSGPNGTNLSLGMQKIVLLVRGLLSIKEKGHKIIIFDEPLTALDKTSREKVIKMIMEECKNKTLIIITHDTEIIPHMDRIVNLKDLL